MVRLLGLKGDYVADFRLLDYLVALRSTDECPALDDRIQTWRGMDPIPVRPVLATIVAAHALGEGSGRLACISFGCCYGRPLDQLPAMLHPWLAPLSVVNRGRPKRSLMPMDSTTATHVSQGLRLLWNPGIILACQILWIGIFLYMGRSHVTGARISFHVRKDRI